MKVLVTGSTGLVGSTLIPFLATEGHTMTRLVRSRPSSPNQEAGWDPERGDLDPAGLEGHDAVVHLAGENIAAGRWTPERKEKIRASRVNGTRLLCEALAGLDDPPKVLVSASAIGYYGERGNEAVTEESTAGSGFLPEVCKAWEEAAQPAANAGIRVVHVRIGIVMSPAGGALAKMLTPFRMGLGGKIGSGKQYMSWISIDDLIGVIHHAITSGALIGPVNAVAPTPVRNSEFTRILGRVLGRPALIPLPAFAAKMMLGEMADELLLASTRVEPGRLKSTGYTFHHSRLEEALRHVLGKI